MKDVRPDRDAGELGSLAGADDAAAAQQHAALARKRSRILRALAIVAVVVVALAVIIGPHLRDDTALSRISGQAAQNAGGATASCPSTPIPRGVVKPSAAVELTSAVVCHYPAGAQAQPPEEAVVPTDQLAGISADMNSNTVSVPLAQAPGLAVPTPGSETWLVVAKTAIGETVQLRGSPYPTVYAWDGLGPGLEWHPSSEVRRMLATDLHG